MTQDEYEGFGEHKHQDQPDFNQYHFSTTIEIIYITILLRAAVAIRHLLKTA